MRKNLTIGVCAVLLFSTASCVSSKEMQTLLQEKKNLMEKTVRLKKENDELSNENFTLTSFAQSKVSKADQLDQKSREGVAALQQKYDLLQNNYNRLNKELQQKLQENQTLQAQINAERQANEKQIDELQEKLRWVYTTYKIKRK